MSLIPATSSATYGIQISLQRLDAAAKRVAGGTDDANLAADMADIKMARHGVSINASVLTTADRMVGTLIDALA